MRDCCQTISSCCTWEIHACNSARAFFLRNGRETARCNSDPRKFDMLPLFFVLEAELNLPIGIGGESARVGWVQWVAAAFSVVAARVSSIGAGFMDKRRHFWTFGSCYRGAFGQVKTSHLICIEIFEITQRGSTMYKALKISFNLKTENLPKPLRAKF